MSDDARQKAEDHYYAALDLFADGDHERALEEYKQSVEADPSFTEVTSAPRLPGTPRNSAI